MPNLGFKGINNVSVKFYKRGWIPLISNVRRTWFILHWNVKVFLLSRARIFTGWVPCYFVVFGLSCARIFTSWMPCYSSGSWSVLRPDFHGLGPLLFQWFLVCLVPRFSRVGSLVIPVVLGLSCVRIFTGWVPCYFSGSWSVLRPDFHGLDPFLFQWFLVCLAPRFSWVGSLFIPGSRF